MENINLIVGNNIKLLRKENNLTQNELAQKLNYSNKAISRWESGEVIPDVATINKICEIFNVPISRIFEENLSGKKLSKSYRLQIGNKLAITLLASLLVWFIAIIGFVYSGIIFNYYCWQVFVWAIPITAIVGIVFNSIWGKKILNFVLISILIWSILVCIYISLLSYNIWPMFLIGVPLQVATILWSNITLNMERQNKSKNE